jgi:cytidylate kinase
MAVITIHRDFASGGRKLGQLLARNLGYHYVDKSLFEKIAQDLHVSESTLESFEQSREYRIPNLFNNLFSKSYIARIVGHDKTIVEESEYQNSLKSLILGVAQEDNVVIIGRAAYYFLEDRENCFHFWVIAPVEWRVNYAVENLGIPLEQARGVLERRDRNKAWFLRSICGEDFENPLFFHSTLNMGRISLAKAVEFMGSVVVA